jgi:transposase
MKSTQEYETQRLDHLGIVAGICKEIGLIEQINEALGESRRKVSYGAAVQAMVLNGLGFSSRAMYLTPQYMNNKPVELLLEAGLAAEDFNDDSLGRTLDRLYEVGVTEVFAGVAKRALDVYGISYRFYHLDSSSIAVSGEYEREREEGEIEITYGYSKDKRPDLKQAVLNLITGHGTRIPVWLEALSGNSSDKQSFPESIQKFTDQMEGVGAVYFVVDSALYSAENLQELTEIYWLTRVPETLAEAKKLIEGANPAQMNALEEGYKYQMYASDYGSVSQRWLLVYSEKAKEREARALEKRIGREKEKAERAWRKMKGQRFNCEKDAQKALNAFQKRWKYHQAEARLRPVNGYSNPGRPRKDASPEVVGYQLEGEILRSEPAIAAASNRLGYFILATNQLDVAELPPQTMLAEYKTQGISVERGFRFLKDPLFFADSLFLKTPRRIMALLMIMTLALLVYALAERQLRLRLLEEDESIPNQLGKATQSPTLRWVFQLFEGIDLLIIRQNGKTIDRRVLNLHPVHITIIQLLGPHIRNCYLFPT